jgi:hypothetical protein
LIWGLKPIGKEISGQNRKGLDKNVCWLSKALPLPRDFPLIESRLRGKVADI